MQAGDHPGGPRSGRFGQGERDLARAASFETPARDLDGLARAASFITAGATVSIAWRAHDTDEDRLAAACAVRVAGFEPLPHLAAREVAGVAACERLLRRLHEEAGVTQIFIVGGDGAQVAGGFGSSLELLAAVAPRRSGIARVGFAAYPEGRPGVSRTVADSELDTKMAVAMDGGLDPFVITQFTFSAEPVVAWLRGFRRRGNDGLVRIGLAGPAGLQALLRYARICGVAMAAPRVLGRGATPVLQSPGETSAEPVLRGLAASGVFENAAPLAVHVFPLGGLERAARWSAAMTTRPDAQVSAD